MFFGFGGGWAVAQRCLSICANLYVYLCRFQLQIDCSDEALAMLRRDKVRDSCIGTSNRQTSSSIGSRTEQWSLELEILGFASSPTPRRHLGFTRVSQPDLVLLATLALSNSI